MTIVPRTAMMAYRIVSDDGRYIIAAESGELLYWQVEERTVIFQVPLVMGRLKGQ
jgi:hypothetical protein